MEPHNVDRQVKIRSSENVRTTAEDAYALHKVADNADPPYRDFVRAKLKVVMKHRGLIISGKERPMVMPRMLHDEFPETLQTFLQEILNNTKEGSIRTTIQPQGHDS